MVLFIKKINRTSRKGTRLQVEIHKGMLSTITMRRAANVRLNSCRIATTKRDLTSSSYKEEKIIKLWLFDHKYEIIRWTYVSWVFNWLHGMLSNLYKAFYNKKKVLKKRYTITLPHD